MSLEILIEKCKKNETKAQSELYKLFSRRLFALCLKYSRNRAEAEDVLQDSFLTIFKKIEQYDNRGSFEGWIKRVTINTALQQYRKQGMLNIVDEAKIEDVTIEDDGFDLNIDFLLNCVQELPDRYRLVFNLYVLDGYSHKEIASMLDISTGTTKSNLARARMILKDKIETYKSQVNLQSL
ncbi:MAG: RNA polymerase sigma factor [Bacteroidia bacterium]|nr:RNA polymerase sigma factor [Bacteroidia bacterium]MBT8268015.1 RNA polymerase sigma factor [Bacteroidia bacterium]NNF82168.1 RNA polymerase sigma factor [Flavobacteriaceae bacterium]NNK70367.1 RNA polymerase sigma factor [Flavobacteriaceae bacterium]NNL79517.1 RNA polymerase sigma factor [Flavobacteriaceae bacterium]